MIEIVNETDGVQFAGSDIEYFIDDKNDIGEVYLDGNLVFQSDNIYNENDLQGKFRESFTIIKEEQING